MSTRTARIAAVVTFGAVLCGCTNQAAAPPARTPFSASSGATTSPVPTSAADSPSPAATPSVFLPEPDAPIPADANALAAALARVTLALRHSLAGWAASGISHAPPRAVVLQSLFQQRIYRTLSRRPALAARTIAALPPWLRTAATDNVTAGARIFSLVRPLSHPSAFHTQPPLPAGTLLGFYREAEQRFGVSWEVLAAVNFIESKFGRVRSASYAGAQGPMQFLPSTWAHYGMGGDVHDPHDAILGAANYLHASGAPADYRRALFAYNPSTAYVDSVLLYARQMARNWRNFLAYYNWQVFVLTTSGDRRLTGPGLG